MNFNLTDIGGLFTGIREALTGEKIQNPEKILSMVNKLETTMIKAQGDIITAEAKSEHWIVASWRPITMLVFVFIIANNYILAPYISMLFSIEVPTLDLTQNMWDLLKLGIGGYIVGRSVEKSAKHFKGK